jgi:hypothetical protein
VSRNRGRGAALFQLRVQSTSFALLFPLLLWGKVGSIAPNRSRIIGRPCGRGANDERRFLADGTRDWFSQTCRGDTQQAAAMRTADVMELHHAPQGTYPSDRLSEDRKIRDPPVCRVEASAPMSQRREYKAHGPRIASIYPRGKEGLRRTCHKSKARAEGTMVSVDDRLRRGLPASG